MKQNVVVPMLLLFLVFSWYVTEVQAAWGLPFDIPGLSDGVTKAIGVGIAPLLTLNATTVAPNLARDCSGRLELVQKIIGNASEPLNSMLTKLKEISNTNSTEYDKMQNAFYHLYTDTYIATGYDKYLAGTAAYSCRTYALKLAPKISSSASYAVTKAVWNLIDSLFKGNDDLNEAINYIWQASDTARKSGYNPFTILTFVTPTIMDLLSAKIANVVAAVDILAQALQITAVEINISLIDPVVTERLPNVVPLLASFNGSADWTRNFITKIGNYIVKKANLTFNPVTLNPSSWNNGNIANLTTFLANFTSLVQQNFTQQFLDAAIDQLRANVTASLTDQSSQLALGFDKVYTVIANTGSSNDCVSRYNATLLTETLPSMLRLHECIQLEADELFVLKMHAKWALKKLRHEATRSTKHLRLCGDQNGPCAKELFASLETQYQRAVTTLAVISDYISTGLLAIAGRIGDCMTSITAEIQSEAQAIQDNLSGCGVVISGGSEQRICPAAPERTEMVIEP